MYQRDFPSWNSDFQCFPEGPIYYDKLFKKDPLTRAVTIEKKFQELKTNVDAISQIPYVSDSDNDDVIMSKTVNEIIQSLQVLIGVLELTDDSGAKNGLQNVLKGKDSILFKLAVMLRIRATISTTRAVEKILSSEFFKRYEIL